MKGFRFTTKDRQRWTKRKDSYGRSVRIVHGMSGTPTYQIWRAMRGRCENPNDAGYVNYGGRGIKVCERWKLFENFLADMGKHPKGRMLERIDNNGDYCPENCKWATTREQGANKRDTRKYTYKGKTLCLGHWAQELGIPRSTLFYRLQRGLTFENAITTNKYEQWSAAHTKRYGRPIHITP